MRIISKFRDYYDSNIQYGIDRSITYVRETKIIEETPSYTSYDEIIRAVIGFCGKLYPFCYKIEESKTRIGHDENRCFYNIDDLGGYLDILKDKRKTPYYRYFGGPSKENFREHYEYYNQTKGDKFFDVFHKYNVPCFISRIAHGPRLILNPCLKDYEFFRVMNAFTAYQEVSMYIGGVLNGPSKPIPEIDDVTMAEAKGFDKWSFRKEPSK